MTTAIRHVFETSDLTRPRDEVNLDFNPHDGTPCVSFGLGGIQFYSGDIVPSTLALHLRDMAWRIDLLIEANDRGVSIDALLAEGVSDGF